MSLPYPGVEHISRLRNVILNPTFWGHTARHHMDAKDGSQLAPTGPWIWEPGHEIPEGVDIYYNTHEPVYTGEDSVKIRNELFRRYNLGKRGSDYQIYWFTKLFICAECGFYMQAKNKGMHLRCQSKYSSYAHRRHCTQSTPYATERYLRAYVDQRLREAITAGVLDLETKSSEATERDGAARLDSLHSEIEELQNQIRRLIKKQGEAQDEMLADFYDQEIKELSAKLKSIRIALVSLEKTAAASHTELLTQRIAITELGKLTVDGLWKLPGSEVNQILHALLGKRRFTLRDGKIVGVADAPMQHYRRRKKSSQDEL